MIALMPPLGVILGFVPRNQLSAPLEALKELVAAAVSYFCACPGGTIGPGAKAQDDSIAMARRWTAYRTYVLASLLTGLLATPATAAPPSRIVSLNLCTDQIVLDLVPRGRIAALSWLAADRDVSPIADDIAGLKLVSGGAEEILTLAPDLVLANPYAAAPAVDLLKRLGYATEVIPFAQDFEGIRVAVRRVAAAVGETARGEAVVARFDAALASATLDPPAGRKPEALVYQVNGLVSGAGSLIDGALAAAGLGNQASTRRLASGGRLALEALVAAPPDLVVLAQAPRTYATVVSDNLRHPALQRLMQLKPSLVLPMPLWLCGSPRITDAVKLLGASAAKLSDGQR
jgi:iron complex transport system substrate-binding protein